jgi:histidinol-phosphate phosphatase family protein
MGTIECHARIRADQGSGLGERQSTENPRTAVFLDRDGTLNVEVHRLMSPDQLELIPGAADGVRRLNRAGFLAVAVTNQAAIARGACTEADLEQIHDKLESLLGEQGAYLDAIYYCPHHPDRGVPGERVDLKIECDCRKPGTAMIERAASDFSFPIENSWMIGDTTVDLQTAQNAGIRSILVRTGYAGLDRRWSARPDFEFSDLKEAVEFVMEIEDRS